MESKATAKFVRVAPRKTRLVARNVKGMPVEAAMNLLRFTPNKPAGVILVWSVRPSPTRNTTPAWTWMLWSLRKFW